MEAGGFSLKKWTSNCGDILKQVDLANGNQELSDLRNFDDASIKTLGLVWKPKGDQFTFKVISLDFNKVKRTKRALAWDISSIHWGGYLQ